VQRLYALGELRTLVTGQPIRTLAGIALGRTSQLQMVWAFGSNASASSSGVRPARASSRCSGQVAADTRL